MREVGQRVVEVGCGIGNLTGLLLDRELVVALDPEAACVERLRERYGQRENLQTLVCETGQPEFRALARFRPDSCVCVNVLEHIQDDGAALAAMASILTPGGVIVLLVPAFEALYGPIDRNLGHYRRYRQGGIARLAEQAGLHVSKAHYVNSVGILGWWVNAHVLKREAQSNVQIAIFDRWLAPMMEQLEALGRPPFGQSLLAVLRK